MVQAGLIGRPGAPVLHDRAPCRHLKDRFADPLLRIRNAHDNLARTVDNADGRAGLKPELGLQIRQPIERYLGKDNAHHNPVIGTDRLAANHLRVMAAPLDLKVRYREPPARDGLPEEASRRHRPRHRHRVRAGHDTARWIEQPEVRAGPVIVQHADEQRSRCLDIHAPDHGQFRHYRKHLIGGVEHPFLILRADFYEAQRIAPRLFRSQGTGGDVIINDQPGKRQHGKSRQQHETDAETSHAITMRLHPAIGQTPEKNLLTAPPSPARREIEN